MRFFLSLFCSLSPSFSLSRTQTHSHVLSTSFSFYTEDVLSLVCIFCRQTSRVEAALLSAYIFWVNFIRLTVYTVGGFFLTVWYRPFVHTWLSWSLIYIPFPQWMRRYGAKSVSLKTFARDCCCINNKHTICVSHSERWWVRIINNRAAIWWFWNWFKFVW